MAETWVDAYYRILGEVERDIPDAAMEDQYEEYARRVQVWKSEHGYE
jgi:hypothetical protein